MMSFSLSQIVALVQREQLELEEFLYGVSSNTQAENVPVEEEQVAITKVLANRHREDSFLEIIKGLAEEHKEIELGFQSSEKISLNDEQQVGVALYRANADAKIIEVVGDIVKLEADIPASIPTVDSQYGYKGGAARLALLATLGEPVLNYIPRDLDLIRVGDAAIELDDLIAAQFMPDDFHRGDGVEIVPSVESYLATRDIVCNEVALFGNVLTCSIRCLEDNLNQILRPSEHVIDEDGVIQSRVVAKMIRMMAISEVEGRPVHIQGVPQDAEVSPFDVALHLDRALERGTRVAQIYVAECFRLGLISIDAKDCQTIGTAIEKLKHGVNGGLKSFKNISRELPKPKSRGGGGPVNRSRASKRNRKKKIA